MLKNFSKGRNSMLQKIILLELIQNLHRDSRKFPHLCSQAYRFLRRIKYCKDSLKYSWHFPCHGQRNRNSWRVVSNIKKSNSHSWRNLIYSTTLEAYLIYISNFGAQFNHQSFFSEKTLQMLWTMRKTCRSRGRVCFARPVKSTGHLSICKKLERKSCAAWSERSSF